MGQKAKTARYKGLHVCDCLGKGVKEISRGAWVCQSCLDRQAYWKITTMKPRTEQPIIEPYVCNAPWFLGRYTWLLAFLLCVSSVMGQSFNFQQVAAVVHVAGDPVTITEGVTNWLSTVPRKEFDRLNDVRKVQSKPFYSWKEFQSNPQINREYVTEYLHLLHSTIKQETGKAPSHHDVFCCYRLGIAKFRKLGFDHSKIKDRALLFECRIFGEFLRNPVLCEEPIPPLSIPRPQGVATGRGRS